MTMVTKRTKLTLLLASVLLSGSASAVTYTDNFSGAASNLSWISLSTACLTAGDGTGTIPACVSPNDVPGSGALRLTKPATNQTGAILSNFTFPLNQGMQVTFTTYTYGGDSQSPAKDGADGITFMLTDGTATVPTNTGGEGGSMGYSCSNVNGKTEGMANAYLGLGIDEFGNYLNSADNANVGVLNSRATGGTTAFGDNPFSSGGPEYQPQRIGLRGAGNTTWAWLNSQNPVYYPGTTPNTGKVQAVCKSGTYVSGKDASGNPINSPVTYNYNAIAGGYRVLPSTTLIANEKTSTRAGNPGTPSDYKKNAWPITYKLTLSPAGLLNFAYSYNNGAFKPVLVNSMITASNGPLPASFRFGFSAGTGGSYNVHEITCFEASPLQSNSSAAANTVQSGEVRTETQIYLASYSSDNWWGSLVSAPVAIAGDGSLSISTVANWDAKCVLTGGGCPAMGTLADGTPINSVTAETPASRTLLTASDVAGTGTALQWASLTLTQQTALNTNSAGVVDTDGPTRASWLRGVRSTEQLAAPVAGNLRARTGVLGDIIDSSPTWVGAPSAGTNPDAFSDAFVGTGATVPENATGAQTYSAYVSSYATRRNVVYVGGNDGFLHGFSSGSYTATGVYDASTNDGTEVIGFMPSGVLANQAVKLTDPNYVHDYLVDATPGVGDLFYNNKWHTWLVGGVGSGGSEIYALDITDPTNFTEANASTLVLGDWNRTTLPHLANTVGTPIITRLHNGQWAIIFGNGIGGGQVAGNESAGVYLGLVDSSTGAITFQFLDTGVGTAAAPNGIAYVTSVDLDGDRIADYLYAGDTKGNVWRFDVTSSSTSNWAVSKFGNGAATPLFVAKDASGVTQPITTTATVASVRTGSTNRVMVLFGTGQKTPMNSTSGDIYATGTQTFYGIWDWDMATWNTTSDVDYSSASGPRTLSRSVLLAQAVVTQSTAATGGQILGFRSMSATEKVCWSGSTTCSSGNTQFGWLLDLPEKGEQIIYNPIIVGGAVVVSTAIPATISALQCNAGSQSGWTMAFDPSSGGGLPESFFPGPDGSFNANSDGTTNAGVRLDAVGSPTTVRSKGKTYLVTQTVKGSASLIPVNPQGGGSPSRVSWKEIRF